MFKKKENKSKPKKVNEKKERTFSPKGLISEAKQIRWAKLRTRTEDGVEKPGMLIQTAHVLVFVGLFALFFVALDAIVSVLSSMI